MVRSDAAAEVIYDHSSSYTRKPQSGASASEWANFMSPNLVDMYRKPKANLSANQLDLDSKNEEMDIIKILKDIEYLGSSSMTWKERKALENRNVVALGGKPPKKHRTPLSVAKVPMKRQKQREEKEREEGLILGRFMKRAGGNNKRRVEKRKPEDRVLRASEGRFSKGVLDVKHLLQPNLPSKSNDDDSRDNGKRKGKGKGKEKKKNKGKGKGKGKRRGRH